MKSEPNTFSIDDLAKSPEQTTSWDGVRNYQARNFMRDMAVGDLVLFYHSNTEPPAFVGTAEVVRAAGLVVNDRARLHRFLAPVHREPPLREPLDRLRVDAVLLDLDAG